MKDIPRNNGRNLDNGPMHEHWTDHPISYESAKLKLSVSKSIHRATEAINEATNVISLSRRIL